MWVDPAGAVLREERTCACGMWFCVGQQPSVVGANVIGFDLENAQTVDAAIVAAAATDETARVKPGQLPRARVDVLMQHAQGFHRWPWPVPQHLAPQPRGNALDALPGDVCGIDADVFHECLPRCWMLPVQPLPSLYFRPSRCVIQDVLG